MRLTFFDFCKKNNLNPLKTESRRYFNRYRKNNPQIYKFQW